MFGNLAAKVQLNDLPDELLVEVLSYLSPKDLLKSARAVCRRWRKLVFHRGVWERISFNDEEGFDWRCLKLAIRFAPCFHTFKATCAPPKSHWEDWDHEQYKDSIIAMIGCTSCAVSRIFISLTDDPTDSKNMREILLHQNIVGRLRSVHFKTSVAHQNVVKVLKAILSCDLDEIVIFNQTKTRFPALRCAINAPTSKRHPLKRLTYVATPFNLTKSLDPFLKQLLTEHSATLEPVHLDETYVQAVPLLSHCSNLIDAWVPASDLLRALVDKCPRLTSLCLQVPEWLCPPGALTFLRSTTQVTSLTLLFPASDLLRQRCHWEDVIVALASSKQSRLGTLTIGEIPYVDFSNEWETSRHDEEIGCIPACLSALPHLHTVVLTDRLFGRDFLSAVSDRVAPALRVLCTRYASPCCRTSPRECYLTAVRDAILRHPLLHLEGLNAEHACDSWGECVCCSAALHPTAGSPRDNLTRRVSRIRPPGSFRIRLCPREQTSLPWLPSNTCSDCPYERLRLPAFLYAYFGHDSSQRCRLHESAYIWLRISSPS